MNMDKLKDAGLSRRKLLKATAVFGGVVAAYPLISACSTDDDSGGDMKAFIIGVKDSPASGFDPYFVTTTAQSIQATLYSYLIRYDSGLNAHGDVAQSWKVSDDNVSISMKLRDDLTFHSGAKISSQDIVAGFKRGKDPKLGATLTSRLSAIKTCTAVDASTVEFTFAYPVPESLMLDTLSGFPVIEASKNTAEQLKVAPAGAGPFKLKKYVSGDRIVLEKFDDYWDTKLPLADQITYQIFDSQDTEVSALKSGSIDIATVIPARLAKSVKDEFTIVKSFPGAQIDLFQMNAKVAPWDNKQMRQAMARVIDRDRIVTEVRFGFSSPVVLPYPPSGPASDPSFLEKYRFDLKAAEALWVAAGSPKGGEIAMSENPETLAVAQVIQSDLKKIGFDLKIHQMDNTTYVKEVHSGDVPCAVVPVSNSLTTPSTITAHYAMSTTNNPWWGLGAPPAEYVDAIEAANQALDKESQKKAWAKLNNVLMDLCWAPGIGLRQNLFPMKKGVTGFAVYPTDDFDVRAVTRKS